MKSYIKAFIFLLFTGLFFSCDNNHSGGSFDATPSPKTAHAEDGIYDNYEDFGRVIWQKPDLVIGEFGDLTGKTVADIGAGTGFFSRRMVQQAEKVIAIDIDKRFMHFLDSIRLKELPEELQPRLEPRLSKTDDPLLKSYEVDNVLIVNTFMYMSNHVDYLEKIKNGLKPGGRIVIVDFKKRWTPIGPPADIRLSMEATEAFLKEAGFKIVKMDRKALEFQYIVVAEIE